MLLWGCACLWHKQFTGCTKAVTCACDHPPTSIQLGGSILHFCLCRRLTASHRGTSACMEGLKGPKSPCKERQGIIFFLPTKHFIQLHTDMRHSLFSEKFGVMMTSSFSARNSTSAGSITMAPAASAEPKLRKITGVMRGNHLHPFLAWDCQIIWSTTRLWKARLLVTVCRSQLS